MSVFDDVKYQAAAERALQFVKNQLDINHFDYRGAGGWLNPLR